MWANTEDYRKIQGFHSSALYENDILKTLTDCKYCKFGYL